MIRTQFGLFVFLLFKFSLVQGATRNLGPLQGAHFSVDSVKVNDTAVVLEGFFYDGRAPDALMLFGRGEVRAENGKYGFIQGYDTPGQPPKPLTQAYNSKEPLTVRLPTGTKLSDYEYFSVYCRQYHVDFGHINF